MGEPKALLDLHGRPLIQAHIAALTEFCDPVIVVTGAHREQVEAVLPEHVQQVHNKDWSTTQTKDSIALGLKALPPEATVLITPVDVPPAPGDVLEMLIEARHPAVPIDEEQRGHPVIVVARNALKTLDAHPLHHHLRDAEEIEVDWPDCTVGFNTMAEWRAWRG